jgi:hypothetical protein
VPGVGIPTALLSGRLAADRVTGVPVTRPRRPVEPARSKPDAEGVRSGEGPMSRERSRRASGVSGAAKQAGRGGSEER